MRIGMLAALLGVVLPTFPTSTTRAEDAKPPREVSSVEERALAARPGDSLFLIVGDRITVARIDRAGVTSRGVRLELAGTHVRGELGGQRVALELGPRRVEGHVGERDVSMDVARGDAALNVEGRFGARGISLHLSPASVIAEVGPCRYALKFQHNEYQGQVGCGGDPVGVRLRVPASLVARGDVELAALFTSLLAR